MCRINIELILIFIPNAHYWTQPYRLFSVKIIFGYCHVATRAPVFSGLAFWRIGRGSHHVVLIPDVRNFTGFLQHTHFLGIF